MTRTEGGDESSKKRDPRWIGFRVSAELASQIDELVAKMSEQGIESSRSSVVRMILRAHLEDDVKRAMLEEAMSITWEISQKALSKIVAQSGYNLPQYMEEALAEYQERAASERVAANE